MAAVTKSTARIGMDPVSGMYAGQISGKLAGEAIAKGDLCYIKGADGKIWKADASAEDEAAKVAGMATDAAAAGEAVTLYSAPSIWDYSDGNLTPGAPLYLSGTAAGGLDTAAGTGHTAPVAQAIDAYRIRLVTHI